MAVVTLYMSDRDDAKTFTSKKDADAYDKMLELAESISQFVSTRIDGLSEQHSEDIGLLLARHKDQLSTAIKGKPEALLGMSEEDNTTQGAESEPHLNLING